MSRVLTSAFSTFFVLLQVDPRQIVEEAQRRTTTQSRPANRIARSLDPVLRYRLQLRRPRGARYEPIRFQASRRRIARQCSLLEGSVDAQAGEGFTIHAFLSVDTQGQLRLRPN